MRLADKLVILGSTYRSGSDTFETPFGSRRGVLVHAAVLNSVLTGTTLRRLGAGWGVLFALLALGSVLLAVWYVPARKAWLLVLGAGALYLLAHFGLFVASGLLLPLALPLGGGLIGAALALQVQKPAWVRQRLRGSDRFLLRLSPEADGGYRVTVEAAPEGVARHAAGTDLASDERLASGLTLAHGLALMARGVQDEALREAVGGALFRRLVPGPVEASYRASRKTAAGRGLRRRALRIGLRIEDACLEAVPWEWAFDPEAKRFLAASPEIEIVRCPLDAIAPEARMPAEGSLSVALAIPDLSSENGEVAVTDAAFDRALLDRMLATHSGIRIGILDPVSPETLGTLQRRSVLHLIAPFREGGTRLALSDDLTVSPSDLADLLRTASPHTLVLEPTRPGASSAALFAFASAWAADAGTPVLALPAALPDPARHVALDQYYAALSDGASPEAAFTRMRLALATECPDTVGMPVLWTASCFSQDAAS